MTNPINNEDIIVTAAHAFEGLVNGDERLAKAKLAHQINALIQEQSMKQQEASELLDITQHEISQLAKGRLSSFTFDRLYRCLYALDMDVEITLKKHIPTDSRVAGIHVSNFGR
jgi:predicted XRE-type DNA-binding protein